MLFTLVLMDAHSSSPSLCTQAVYVQLGKFSLSPKGSRPYFNRDVQHGLAWLNSSPHVSWCVNMVLLNLRDNGS